jgi:hypothetical protein
MNQYLVAAILLAATASASAAPERTVLAAFSADQLKSAYLDCDRAASGGLASAVEAAHCSVVHEELKERVFGGDFDRLLAWWKAEQVAERLSRDSAQRRLPRPQEVKVGSPLGQ